MRRIVPFVRSLAVAGLLIGLIATFSPLGTTEVSAQSGEVELSIHVLDCPNDAVGNIFKACHDNRLEDVDFTIGDDEVTSDDEGVVEAIVAAGMVEIEEVDFDTIATNGRAVVYCSPQPEGEPLTEDKTTDGSVKIEIADNVTEVHCDWYNRTDPNADGGGDDTATVMIHAIECPVDAEGDIFEACHDNRIEDVTFDVEGIEAISDEDGEATAENVLTGDVTIEEIDFDSLATSGRAFVYCSVQPGGEPVLTEGNTRNGLVTIDIPNNVTEVHCDWYNRTSDFGPTPTEDPGQPTNTPYPTNTPQPTQTGGGSGGDNTTNCANYTYQEDAQDVYDQDTSDPNNLDSDNDGVACEHLPKRGSGGSAATATVKTTLPTTGAGPADDSGSTGLVFGLILVLLLVGAAAFGRRRHTESANAK